MATIFRVDLGTTSSIDLGLSALNLGDSKLHFEIDGATSYQIQPTSKVRAMIVPSSSTITSTEISGLLTRQNIQNIPTSGFYFFEGGENNSSQDNLTFKTLTIDEIQWENQTFDLHWVVLRGNDVFYDSNTIGIYSLPHNIQPSEIIISGNLLSGGDQIKYDIIWNEIQNDDDIQYGSYPSDGPYSLNVLYKYPSVGDYVSGFSSTIYYGSGTMSSGISIILPFYDERKTYQNTPAIYNFELNNVTASGNILMKPGSTPLVITIDHQKMLDSNFYFKNLDNYTFKYADKNKLRKMDIPIKIDSSIINRTRIGIGISDISIKENTYVKQGIYVSKQYPLDFNMYTFSLRVNETIPDYSNLNPYDMVKYYVEFNSNKWEAISPINRKDEYFNGSLVPKIFIFDKTPDEDISDQVKYIIYNSNVNAFRLKIIFDLSSVIESKFIPPEIRDYKCIIYDKDQFFNV